MKIKLDEYSIEVLNKAREITITNYEYDDGSIEPEALINCIEDLMYEVHNLEEKLKDTEDYYHDNFEPIPAGRLYGVNDSSFH